jgi:sugar/nucleoside kinase (ribokinase family)
MIDVLFEPSRPDPEVRSAMATTQRHRARVVVLGDVVVDVVLAPGTEMETGTDVLGRVMLRQGGSGTTTARWLGRGGARVALIGAVGRDAAGRALVRTVRDDGVSPHVVRVAGRRTGRIGVFVATNGERSFVQDRAAALFLSPENLRESWFARVELVHIPTYSLLGHPLGDAGLRAAELGHAAGGLVTVDLASSRPLLSLGREAALGILTAARPDLLFAAGTEAAAIVESESELLDLAPIAVLKRGPQGVRILWREGGAAPGETLGEARDVREVRSLEVPAVEVAAEEMTGAGDAFDAGFILEWLAARRAGRSLEAGLRSAAVAGNRLAARHLLAPKHELRFD